MEPHELQGPWSQQKSQSCHQLSGPGPDKAQLCPLARARAGSEQVQPSYFTQPGQSSMPGGGCPRAVAAAPRAPLQAPRLSYIRLLRILLNAMNSRRVCCPLTLLSTQATNLYRLFFTGAVYGTSHKIFARKSKDVLSPSTSKEPNGGPSTPDI